MHRRILVAVDESESSKRALDEALKLAGGNPLDQPVSIRLLHVLDDALDQSELAAVGRAVLDEAGRQVAAAGASAFPIMIPCRGRTIAAVILAEAQAFPADLIVVGSRGLTGLRRAIVGSVAQEVIRDSPLPVLLPGATSHK